MIEIVIFQLKLGQFPYAVDDALAAALFTARYAICFAAGALVAYGIMCSWNLLNVIGRYPLAILVIAYMLFSSLLDQPSILGACLIIIAALRSRRLQQVLSTTITLWLGRISYSLYLTHIVTLKLITYLASSALPPILTAAISVPAGLIVAEIFHRLVEAPTISLSRRIGRHGTSSLPNPIDAPGKIA